MHYKEEKNATQKEFGREPSLEEYTRNQSCTRDFDYGAGPLIFCWHFDCKFVKHMGDY